MDGASIKAGQIPYNMEKDIDRLCLENAIKHFMESGKKEDAFDVYFCYLEMFVGDYEKTRRMIELLSEFEANGSGLLMKHRDHYSHSVYVFTLGLAIYQTNTIYKDAYKAYYKIENDKDAACHYLKYWGMSSLFHDIGYPFELPFEQVASYFEVDGNERNNRPFVAYYDIQSFIQIDESVKEKLSDIVEGKEFENTNELFAYLLADKLGEVYHVSEEQMLGYLKNKPTKPNKFGHYMDHAYFSASVLFKKLFGEMECQLNREYLDALTGILMHNSLYKFCIANPNMEKKNPDMHMSYKNDGSIPLKPEVHPLAYMLMLCDELQCWDRTAYGRNSKKELHPMGCTLEFSDTSIKAVYLFDEKEMPKINRFKDACLAAYQNGDDKIPGLKAYSGMYLKQAGISEFQKDIECIVDLSEIKLVVETGLKPHMHTKNRNYLSDSNFINLYNFAIILNGRWSNEDWKKAKLEGKEDEFLANEEIANDYLELFKGLSLEYKLSNINQAKSFARYMKEIDCFYTDKAVGFELLESFTQQELLAIGLLEHQRWLQEHYDMGWTYGNPNKEERDFLRQHKDMIPGDKIYQEDISEIEAKTNYERLDKAEQDKDTEPMECMLSMLKLFDGLRIYKLN